MNTKTLKFPPSSFLEIDNMLGGRRVVMTGKDGVTFWDSVDPAKVTPVSLHPVLDPKPLGSCVEYVQANGLAAALNRVREHLRAQMDPRLEDALFIMRVLWSLNGPKGGTAGWEPDDQMLEQALEAAEQQELSAQRLQTNAVRFCDMEAA